MKKNILKLTLVVVSGMFFLAACTKDETPVTYKGGTTPVLSSSVTTGDTIPLVPSDSLNTVLDLSWTNPNYTFSDGISSLNVNYYIQVDSAGANFSSANMQTISISSDLKTSFTVTSLNKLLANGLLLQTGMAHQIEIRLESFIGSGAVPLYSNTLSFTVTPYAPPPKIAPPASGTLYIVGSAVAGGWNNPITVNPATQQFSKISNTEYKITIPLIGGGEYKLIGVNGSWNDQWSVATADTEPNGGDFVFNGANCIAPSASGTYDIDVNFQIGKFTVTPH